MHQTMSYTGWQQTIQQLVPPCKLYPHVSTIHVMSCLPAKLQGQMHCLFLSRVIYMNPINLQLCLSKLFRHASTGLRGNLTGLALGRAGSRNMLPLLGVGSFGCCVSAAVTRDKAPDACIPTEQLSMHGNTAAMSLLAQQFPGQLLLFP